MPNQSDKEYTLMELVTLSFDEWTVLIENENSGMAKDRKEVIEERKRQKYLGSISIFDLEECFRKCNEHVKKWHNDNY